MAARRSALERWRPAQPVSQFLRSPWAAIRSRHNTAATPIMQTALGQPAAAPTGRGGKRTEGRARGSAGAGTQGRVEVTSGRLGDGLQGGNGAPPRALRV